jgi:CheY-like chemotaxis protein
VKPVSHEVCKKVNGENNMRETILLVDDNKMFLEIEKEFLQYSPVDILTAENGLEALQKIRNKRPNLVLTDLNMPIMDGITFCRTIKSDYSLINIPVVLVTAQGNEKERNDAFSAGCDMFLTKPLNRDCFLGAARLFVSSINRREKRRQKSINATCRLNNETISCQIHDLGVGGAFIATTNFGIPKSVIQLVFSLPDGTIVNCQGRIAWVNRISSIKPIGFGVQFALLPNLAKEALAKFIMEGE